MTTLHLLPAAASATKPRGSARLIHLPAWLTASLLPGVVSFFGAILHAVLTPAVAALRWISDGSTWQEIDGTYCSDCRDVHPRGECPRAMAGLCVDCSRTRLLDRFGNCSICGSTSVLHRRPYWTRTFPTLRLAPTREADATMDEAQPATVRDRSRRS